MYLIGDLISLLLGLIALIYLIITLIKEKKGIYFQMIACAIGGCYLFLLSANYGCMDGIIDDGTPLMNKSRKVAWIAPLIAVALFIVNFFADVPLDTKQFYFFVWIPAATCSYYNLKHTIAPDMGFGFIKAIRPFNIAALTFNMLNLLHFTAWNYFDWPVLTITGTLVGISSIIMAVMAKRGVKRWTI